MDSDKVAAYDSMIVGDNCQQDYKVNNLHIYYINSSLAKVC